MNTKGTHMSYLLPKPHIQTGDVITQGGKMPLTIQKWGLVEVYSQRAKGNVEKGALYFRETNKYLIVNETQLEQIKDILKSETLEEWVGKKIVLVHERVKVGLQMKDAIRIQAFTGQPAPQPAANGNGHAPKAENSAPANPASNWHASGEERWKAGQVRSATELRELRTMLGIDDEQIKSWVAENKGDISTTYDAVLKQYADLIMKMGTKQTEGNDAVQEN